MMQAPGTGMEAALTNEEIQSFAAEWYRKLDEQRRGVDYGFLPGSNVSHYSAQVGTSYSGRLI